jgi:protein TonB
VRALVLLAVGLIHVALGLVIVFGLAGGAAALLELPAPALVLYRIPPEPPAPSPPASPAATSKPAGDTGAAAKHAKPKAIAAAPARIPAPAVIAAPVASTGDSTRSGANSAGAGTGGGALGLGTGSGGSGDGSGAGAQRAVKIAGDISATRDFPPQNRDIRLGSSVIVVLTVGTDGHVRACRIHQAGRDPDADAITCRLAMARFRFRPATDRTGAPVESEYGWRQRWFAP